MFNNVFTYRTGTRYFYFRVKKNQVVTIAVKSKLISGNMSLKIINRLDKSYLFDEELQTGYREFDIKEGKYLCKLVFNKAKGGYTLSTKKIN